MASAADDVFGNRRRPPGVLRGNKVGTKAGLGPSSGVDTAAFEQWLKHLRWAPNAECGNWRRQGHTDVASTQV